MSMYHLSEESPTSSSGTPDPTRPLHSMTSATCSEKINATVSITSRNQHHSESLSDASVCQDDEDEEESQHKAKRRRRRWALALYSATTVLLYADQNLMSPNLSAMAEEFQFSDIERDKKLGGDIALGFWMLGVPASFVVGCLADHMNRSVLFAWTVGLGEGACLLTYFTTTYTQLFICRAVTGFSLGGALPLIYSVLGDFFPAEERHAVTAIVSMGTGLGISIGQATAGFLGPTFGWRLPFLVVSVPALVLAAVVLMTVTDPERGGMERAVLQNNKHASNGCRQNREWTSIPQQEQAELVTRSSHPGHMGENEDGTATVELTSLRSSSARTQHHENFKVRRRDSPLDGDDRLHPLDAGCVQNRVETAPGRDHPYNDLSTGTRLAGLFQLFCSLLSRRTVLLALLQGAPGCVPWGIVNTYLNDYLSDDRGMSVEFATLTLLVFGLGNFIGLVVGGAVGTWLYKRDPRYPSILSGSSAILGCIPFFFLVNYVDSSSSLVSVAATALLAGTGSGVTGPIVKATLQNVTLPTTRGQAFALANTFDDFGRGLGPVFVAMLIATAGGRTPAFNIGLLGWVICGVLNLTMFLTVAQDEQSVQAILIQMLDKEDVQVD